MKRRNGNVLNVMSKEFARFFGDKRLVITTVILPGLLIYLIYSFMGAGMNSIFLPSEDKASEIYAVDMPESVKQCVELLELDVKITDTDKLTDAEITELLKSGDANVYAEFPSDFDSVLAGFVAGVTAPMEISIYFDSTDADSSMAYGNLAAALDLLESSVSNLFNVNAGGGAYDIATEEDTTGMFYSMIIPLLLTMFMFTGCLSVAPESIAGEKERGTIAALLVTPVKRVELAVGKILSLSCIALLSGISSFIGTMASLPKLMGDLGEEGLNVSASVYGAQDYAGLFFIVISTVLLLVSLISIISAFAKSVKEAGTLVSPLMIVVMLVGVTTMFGGGAPSNNALYLIPVYNSVQCMNGIFSFSGSFVQVIITVVANLCYTVALAFALKKMFDSESIMFSK